MSVSEVLAAERALGRLVQQHLDAPTELQEALEADAQRREVEASLALDGVVVDVEDLAIAEISVERLPEPRRPNAREALQLAAAATRLRRGFTETAATVTPGPPQEPTPRMDGAAIVGAVAETVAAVRAATAELEAFLAMIETPDEPRTVAPRPITPLSRDWLGRAWSFGVGTMAEPAREALDRAAVDIDEALSTRPGLLAVSDIVRRLHAPDYWPAGEGASCPPGLQTSAPPAVVARMEWILGERDQRAPGGRFVRLIAPWLVERACGLGDRPGPWLSTALVANMRRFPFALVGEQAPWERWFFRSLADEWFKRLQRLPSLQARLEGWQRACQAGTGPGRGRGRRPSRGGPMAALPLLLSQPVITAEWLARRQGITLRSAQDTILTLERTRVVREISGDYAYRLYQTVGA